MALRFFWSYTEIEAARNKFAFMILLILQFHCTLAIYRWAFRFAFYENKLLFLCHINAVKRNRIKDCFSLSFAHTTNNRTFIFVSRRSHHKRSIRCLFRCYFRHEPWILMLLLKLESCVYNKSFGNGKSSRVFSLFSFPYPVFYL